MPGLPTIQLECKKDGLQQLQNGSAKLVLTVNPEDMGAAISSLWAAPMGTRYQVVMVEIGDDEQPVNREPQPGDEVKSVAGYAKPPMTESQRCAMLCNDPGFQEWLKDAVPSQWDPVYALMDPAALSDVAAETIRRYLEITSRKELDRPGFPLHCWQQLVAQYKGETDTSPEPHHD